MWGGGGGGGGGGGWWFGEIVMGVEGIEAVDSGAKLIFFLAG